MRKNNQRASQKTIDDFWKKEYQANNTPKKSIEHLHYITIDLDMLPFLQINDPECDDYYDTLQKLSGKKIVNLSGITNTELKLTYGTSQFPLLSSYDENFTRLITTLYALAKRLHAIGHEHEARTVLEYGIACGTDITNHYILLANMYKDSGDNAKIGELIHHAQELHTPLKEHLVKTLLTIQ